MPNHSPKTMADNRASLPAKTELSAERLLDEALTAMGRAYAPYSGFRVGAAILADDGSVFLGANVENASYGLTICAERAAAAMAVFSGAGSFRALAVATDGDAPVAPCGACRQVLAEFADNDMPVFSRTVPATNGFRRWRLGGLLPDPFKGLTR